MSPSMQPHKRAKATVKGSLRPMRLDRGPFESLRGITGLGRVENVSPDTIMATRGNGNCGTRCGDGTWLLGLGRTRAHLVAAVVTLGNKGSDALPQVRV